MAGASGSYGYHVEEEQGALLQIKHPATEWKLRTGKQLSKYMSGHHRDWMNYANNVFELGIRDEDLILVSGYGGVCVDGRPREPEHWLQHWKVRSHGGAS